MNLGTSDHDKMTSSGNLDVLDVIFIIFITLKIIGVEPVASWPWVIVLTPIWVFIGAVAFVAFLGWIVKQIGKDDNK